MARFNRSAGCLGLILFATALVGCSERPPDDLIQDLITQSQPGISHVEIMKVGGYDEERNVVIVRAKYLWTPHSLMREECVSDFMFFRDTGTNEWRLAPSSISVSRRVLP